MSEPTKKYETLEEAAKKWRVSLERLKYACEQGDVPGAALLSGEWIIPSDVNRPRIRTIPKPPKPAATYVDGKGETVLRTPVQEAVVRSIEKGENLGGVSEYKIGNTTYIVKSVFKRQGPTAEELAFDRAIRGLQDEGAITSFPDAEMRKTIADERKEVRSKSPVFTMSKDEKMEHYRNMLIHYDFTQEEVERLMVKIEADYEEPEFDPPSPYQRGK